MTQMTAAQEKLYKMSSKEIAADLKWLGKLESVVAHSGIMEKIESVCADLESGRITPDAAVNALLTLRSKYWVKDQQP